MNGKTLFERQAHWALVWLYQFENVLADDLDTAKQQLIERYDAAVRARELYLYDGHDRPHNSQQRSARDAMMMDFNVVMVSDCLAALSDDEHRAALETFIQQFGDVMTGEEALAVLRAKPN